MSGISEILDGAERLLHQLIVEESSKQGHTLSGQMEESIKGRKAIAGKEKVLTGIAVFYTKYVNDGVPAESASMKQFPFLVKYFIARGEDEETAKGYAAATIKKWMKEGMSTQASKSYSKTGARQNFVESAITGGDEKINSYMLGSFDFTVDEQYKKTKSETI